MPGYLRSELHSFQHKKTNRSKDSPYPWTQSIYGKNNQMLNEKKTAEELDKKNQEWLQKIVGKFLYYARVVDPTNLVALNSLAAVQKKSTIETAKQITQFLYYSTSHPDVLTEYRRSGMILHIYSDESYISEPEAHIRAEGYFSLSPKSINNTQITAMPP